MQDWGWDVGDGCLIGRFLGRVCHMELSVLIDCSSVEGCQGLILYPDHIAGLLSARVCGLWLDEDCKRVARAAADVSVAWQLGNHFIYGCCCATAT